MSAAGRPRRSNAGKRTSLPEEYASIEHSQLTRSAKSEIRPKGKDAKAKVSAGEFKLPSLERETSRSKKSTVVEPKTKPMVAPKKPVVKTRKSGRKKENFEDYYSEADDSEESEYDEEEDKISQEDLLEDERDDIDFNNMSFPHDEADSSSIAPWADLDPDEIPPLLLPDSSQDLNVPIDLIIRVTELYDFFRVYSRYLQFSPCLYEDFCAAFLSSENSMLLAELHLVLMRLCWREDDDKQVLRLYVQSDKHLPQNVIEALSVHDYPFVSAATRLTVIEWLRDCFLESSVFKEIIKNEGKIVSESICRLCGKLGDIVMCDGCEAAYHPTCLDSPDLPEGKWFCPICQKDQAKGISDCLSFGQLGDRTPLRIEPLGKDRHARIYWFTARRLFVQDPSSPDDLVYYSTLPQFHELLSRLDHDYYEKMLVDKMNQIFNDIIEQMAITIEVTSLRRAERVRSLYEKNSTITVPEAVLHLDNANRVSEILTNCYNRETAKLRDEDENEAEVLSGNLSMTENLENMMGITRGRLTSAFWSGNLPENEVLLHRSQKYPASDVSSGYRLGFDDHYFVNYRNHREEDLAKPLSQRKRESDRKKYLCLRFSLEDWGAFKWVEKRAASGFSKINTCYILEDTMLALSKKIPIELYHRLWPKFEPDWLKIVATRSVRHLREALLWLECGLRKPVFISQWWNGLGMTRFIKTTMESREARTKDEEKRKKKERNLVTAAPEDEDFIFVKFAKLGGPPKHGVWRQKDEQYRINGKGALGGWIWKSRTHKRNWMKAPTFLMNEDAGENSTQDELKKQARLELITSKIVKWGANEKSDLGAVLSNQEQNDGDVKDLDILNSFFIDPPVTNEEVKDQNGLQVKQEDVKPDISATVGTAGVVSSRNPQSVLKKPDVKQILGEDSPFPLPSPFRFQRANKATSLLVLPTLYLRKMARQGGLNSALYYPGFNRTFKSNHHVWNYPCPRPHLELCWKWSTLHARSLQSVALQLRLLWACVRWADLQTETKDEERTQQVIQHLLDRDESRIVIGHKEMPPDGFYERYQLKVEITMIDEDDGDDGTVGTSSRNRKRKSVVVKKSDLRARGAKRVETRWIDGVELKLWEITNYWRNRNRRTVQVVDKTMLRSQPMQRGLPPPPSTMSLRSDPRPRAMHSPAPYSTARGGSSYIPRPMPVANRSAPLLNQRPLNNGRPLTSQPTTSAYSQNPNAFVRQILVRKNPDGTNTIIEEKVVRKRILDQDIMKGEFLEDYKRAVADLPNVDKNSTPQQHQLTNPQGHFETGEPEPKRTLLTENNEQPSNGIGEPTFSVRRAPPKEAISSGNIVSSRPFEPRVLENGKVNGCSSQNYLPTSSNQSRIVESSQPPRTMLRAPPGNILPPSSGGRRLIMIRKADGTTQILRPVSGPREEIGGPRIIHRVQAPPPIQPQHRVVAGPGTFIRTSTPPFRVLSQPSQQMRPIDVNQTPNRLASPALLPNGVHSFTTAEERTE
ncbi:unnamed protein product, partial [Mesorhabditis belari]|uniref:Uncharacterized protein n=1 Tax=Mesorhabditis belari TaxID=2138241 RepID=A0AAF3EWD9_9BILA